MLDQVLNFRRHEISSSFIVFFEEVGGLQFREWGHFDLAFGVFLDEIWHVILIVDRHNNPYRRQLQQLLYKPSKRIFVVCEQLLRLMHDQSYSRVSDGVREMPNRAMAEAHRVQKLLEKFLRIWFGLNLYFECSVFEIISVHAVFDRFLSYVDFS